MSTVVWRPSVKRTNGPGNPPLYVVVDKKHCGAYSIRPGPMRMVCSAFPPTGVVVEDPSIPADWSIGIAAYAGAETALLNAASPPNFKRSRRSTDIPLFLTTPTFHHGPPALSAH